MSGSEQVGGTVIGADGEQPVDILYLDRPRLSSYASQLYAGLPRERQLRDWIVKETRDAGPQVDSESGTTRTTTGKAGLSIPVALAGEHAESRATIERRQGPRREYGTQEGSEQHTTLEARDNVLLALLSDLRQRGWLQEFDPNSPAPGLFEVTGPIRFFDWTLISHFLGNWGQLGALARELDKSPKKQPPPTNSLSKDSAKAMKTFVSAIGLSGFHAHMSPLGQPLVAPLANQHLTITIEQMLITYLRDEPVNGTLIAYINPATDEPVALAGMAKMMSFQSLIDSFIGDSVKALPLALYFPIAGPE